MSMHMYMCMCMCRKKVGVAVSTIVRSSQSQACACGTYLPTYRDRAIAIGDGPAFIMTRCVFVVARK